MSTSGSAAITADAVAHWQAWVGRATVDRQRLDIESLRRYAAATGESLAVETTLPALAHWAWFLPVVARDAIGADGHPARGGFLPPVPLPRRMFAAADMRFHAPLQLDAEATLTSTIAEVRHRSGRSGELVFVEVDRQLAQNGGVCVEERQTIVYRDAGAVVPTVPVSPQAQAAAGAWCPGPVDLFRFSAVTFNAHRIHYDQAYAREVEGYPDLVVHGPFTAARLFAHARDHAGRPPTAFAFRAQAPLFASQPVRLIADGDAFHALRSDDTVAMVATVAF